ncbi:MAG: hypothetical protein GY720_08900, partial [bacterium]|nr:hypothetical protein [bacterium]
RSVIDVYVSKRPNTAAARHFFETALAGQGRPTEVTTDLAAPLLRVIDELIPEAAHDTKRYVTDRVGPRPPQFETPADAVTTNSAPKPTASIFAWRPLRRARRRDLTEPRHQTGSPRPPIDQRNGTPRHHHPNPQLESEEPPNP